MIALLSDGRYFFVRLKSGCLRKANGDDDDTSSILLILLYVINILVKVHCTKIRRVISRNTFKKISNTLKGFMTSTVTLQWFLNKRVDDSKHL